MRKITRFVAVCAWLAGALSLLPACEMDCGPDAHEVDGRCLWICGPGTTMGDDGLCHADGDHAEGDGDADPAEEPDSPGSPGESDAGADVEGEPPEAPLPSTPSGGGDCDDEESCSLLAGEAVGLLNAHRDDLGECGSDSLVVDDHLTVVAQQCAVMMRDSHDIAACSTTLRDRLLANGYDDIRYASESFAHAMSLEPALDGLLELEVPRQDLLDCHYNRVGVGIAADERSIWVCVTLIELLEI